MMRKGTNPNGASPARRAPNGPSAGRMRGDELAPGRGPLDQQIWGVVQSRRPVLRVGVFQSRQRYSTILSDRYLNSIAHSGSCFGRGATRQFQYRRRAASDRSKTPGPQIALDVDYGHGTIQIDHVDGKSHAQSMNAVAGDNPEAGAVTEVTRSQAKQAAQTSPVRVGHGQGCGEIRLAGPIECLPLRGKNCHECKCSHVRAVLALPSTCRRKPVPVAGSVR